MTNGRRLSSLILKYCPRAVVMTRAVGKDPKDPKDPKDLKDLKDLKALGGPVAAKADDAVDASQSMPGLRLRGSGFLANMFLVMMGPAAILIQ
jgi:hypothetical protein